MAQSDTSNAGNGSSINDKVAKAKSTLSNVSRDFPSAKPAAAAAPHRQGMISSMVNKVKANIQESAGIGKELGVKAQNVSDYAASAPKMHKGGRIPADGIYSMKAGEHVLTAKEAVLAKKHALMAVGMKSLAKTQGAEEVDEQPTTSGEPAKPSMGSKKSTSGITVRPEGKVSNKQGQNDRPKIKAASHSKGKPTDPVSPKNSKSGVMHGKSSGQID